MRKISFFVLIVVSFYGCALVKKKKPAVKPAVSAQGGANAASNINRPPVQGPKPYKEVITKKAETDTGLFMVHKVEERFYFEIADSLLNRDILIVNRIAKAAAGVRASMMGYAGDQINDNVVRFEKGPSNRIFLKSISFSERSQDTTGMYLSVLNSNVQPIVAAFDVKAYAQDSVTKAKGSVIDVTDYLNSDNDIFFFDAQVKKALSLGNLLSDRSYIREIRSFPMNVEVRTVKTYARAASPQQGSGGGAAGGPITYELNSSMVLLPSRPMQARYFDPRVGYFATGYVDFDANPQGVKAVSLITRWRLEPKDEDIEKYKRGELVEPKKPIVFYIDPATPRKWVPYLIQGVNDWQVAFEKAGFKNAILAKEAPKDKDWNIDDARHNAIIYKPSDIPNASGPHVHDPRTGEILETHINWYHNVMSLVHNWYMIQTAAADPRARKMEFDDELMGQLIRFVSSHEVGHTLGLRHNFGSSSTVPVEKLRDKKWVEANGHTPSIMDYARFNYVAQPEDHIGEKGLFPRIGDYDTWAIEWGYRWFPQYKNGDEEATALNKWIIERTGKNKRLWFGTESDPNDPRCQNEDLGDNAALAGSYGIKNLKRILPELLQWTRVQNEGYNNARILYNEVFNQYNRYMGHAAKYVGGIYSNPKTVEEPGTVYQVVPYSRQKEAVTFLNSQLFSTPLWLVNSKLISQTGVEPVSVIRNIQTNTLGRLQSASTVSKLINAEAVGTGAKVYTVSDLFSDLKKGIWQELDTHQSINVYRRNLQKAYISNLSKLLQAPSSEQQQSPSFLRASDPTISDVSSIARAHLMQLKNEIHKAIPSFSGMGQYHLQDLEVRIGTILDPK